MDFVGKQTFGFRRVCEPTCPSACWLAPHHATAGTWHIPCCPGVKQHLWGSSVDPCWSSLQDSAAPGHPAVSATCFTSELNFLLNNTWWLEKCSRNHCISEKYKSIQLFKLHFFHKNPLELVYILTATTKVLETSLESILYKTFQFFRHILNYRLASQKPPSLQY